MLRVARIYQDSSTLSLGKKQLLIVIFGARVLGRSCTIGIFIAAKSALITILPP
jgi:hypothetical protein